MEVNPPPSGGGTPPSGGGTSPATPSVRRVIRARFHAPVDPYVLGAVDPGQHSPGLAAFWVGPGGALLIRAMVPTLSPRTATPEIAAGRTRQMFDLLAAPHKGARVVVAEKPQAYATRSATGHGVRALQAFLGVLNADHTWTPGEWKGNIPKLHHHRRIERVMDAARARGILHLPTEANGDWRRLVEDSPDAMDALGIGLWALGWMGRGGALEIP